MKSKEKPNPEHQLEIIRPHIVFIFEHGNEKFGRSHDLVGKHLAIAVHSPSHKKFSTNPPVYFGPILSEPSVGAGKFDCR